MKKGLVVCFSVDALHRVACLANQRKWADKCEEASWTVIHNCRRIERPKVVAQTSNKPVIYLCLSICACLSVLVYLCLSMCACRTFPVESSIGCLRTLVRDVTMKAITIAFGLLVLLGLLSNQSIFGGKPGDWPMLGRTSVRSPVVHQGNAPVEWNAKTGQNIKWSAKLGSQTYGTPVKNRNVRQSDYFCYFRCFPAACWWIICDCQVRPSLRG